MNNSLSSTKAKTVTEINILDWNKIKMIVKFSQLYKNYE